MIEELLTAPFWIDIENWPLSWEIGGTSWFPFLESIHVIAAALVVGAIATIDLRLLGVAAVRYPLSTLGREILPWVWGAFMIASITGLGMFITRAASHVVNPAFQWKIVLLALAGANMLHLHRSLTTLLQADDTSNLPHRRLRLAGLVSLLLWCGVMLAGRWIGHIV
jgi:hypothetical protein